MSAQDWIDRRRLRRKLGFWRLAAILLLIAGLLAIPFLMKGGTDALRGPEIASVKISGVITEDDERLALLEDLADNPRVRAVILKVNSPGGTTVGGETLYHAVRRLSLIHI